MQENRSGWVGQQPVDIYLVDAGPLLPAANRPGEGWAIIKSPEDQARHVGDLLATVQADDNGAIAGTVSGALQIGALQIGADPIVQLTGTTYSLVAVQHVDNAFKVAEPATLLQPSGAGRPAVD